MFNIQEELKKVPAKSGVYLMKDENGSIIYVGKAVLLNNRIRQYFQAPSKQTFKVQALVSRISSFEYIVTNSELEALILECNLIKKHKPKYNVLLKDGKNYPYIKVTMNEKFPRIVMTRKIQKDGAKYFGPYSNTTVIKETIDLIKKMFPIKSCEKVLPRDTGKDRPCLNYHIYQCMGPCQGNVDEVEYKKVMKNICGFLSGKQENLIKDLKRQMERASADMEFEKAAAIRDKINSLRQISEKQKVLSVSLGDHDFIGFARDEANVCVEIFFVRGGKMIGREQFHFKELGDVTDTELMTSFIKQFYSSSKYIPGEVMLQVEVEDRQLIEMWLAGIRKKKVILTVPHRGEKYQLLKMVSQNAHVALSNINNRVGQQEMQLEGLEQLTSLLELGTIPLRIEAYDISNTGVTEKVASMVVFDNGLPAKGKYRRFKIKAQGRQNDYASMQEVVFRRFKHNEINKQNVTDSSFEEFPDLILVDGGLGHVNAVYQVLEQLNIEKPVFGMVKDSRHNTRGLVSKQQEINLKSQLPVLRLITYIQNEAHRFALQYNKILRKKRYNESSLDNVNGIGSSRKKALIRHFSSVKKIKEADVKDLQVVQGISSSTAQKIYNHFHND